MSGASEQEWQTSLGPPLVQGEQFWQLDLRSLSIVHGLSVLSRALAEMVATQVRSDRVDIDIQRSLRPRENPELLEVYGVDTIRLSADRAAIEHFVDAPERIERHLRALLGSLQRQRYRDSLFPKNGGGSSALVAEFVDDVQGAQQVKTRFILEYIVARTSSGRSGLRVSIERPASRHIDLDSIPHSYIEDVAERQFIAGSTRIAQSWTEALRREALRGRRSFVDRRDPHSHLFHQLDQAGLGDIQSVSVQWSELVLSFLIENEPAVPEALLKRVLLALEDRGIRRLLANREVVRVDAGPIPVYLDISQLGRVLELSLGQRRPRADANAFLARMPQLSQIVAERGGDQPLKSVPVFLVHHMTAEIVGTIAAIRALGCRDLTCLFVSYAGEPPASYLDAVLDLPPDEFCALALDNLPQKGAVEGVYRLSKHYSQLDDDVVVEVVRNLDGATHYVDAMRAAAVVPFLRQVARAESNGQQCLLVEDGGYVAPVLLDALASSCTVGQFAGKMGHECSDERSLAQVVGSRLIGCVEHTRNGFDRLDSVFAKHGKLSLPTYSIAISSLKRMVESREVAASVLNASEAVLNADGFVLSRRSCLVLGSRGAIGRELCSSLRGRLDDPDRCLTGIDRVHAVAPRTDGLVEADTMAGLPSDRWLSIDLVLGVTGESVLTGADIEQWLLQSENATLVLASGSTKKVEYGGVMKWFDSLQQTSPQQIQGIQVAIEVEELLDPRTARAYGHRWHFDFGDAGQAKTILTLANLTPINFLFYGVATEIIDEVLAQLLTVTLAAVRRKDDPASPGQLMAVDRDVDAEGAALSSPKPANL